MSRLVIDVPQEGLTALGWDDEQAELECRLAIAVQLYRTGKYSAGGASEAAGVPVTVFNARRGEFGLTFDYTEEDLANDLVLGKVLHDRR